MLNEEKCWDALCAHDASQDGQWFYSVKTTGVYCRPGCASRLRISAQARSTAAT